MRSVSTTQRILTSTALLLGCCGLTPILICQGRVLPDVDLERTTEGEVPDGLSTGDWSAIREAYDAGRHEAYATEDGYQARNAGQQWLTHFDGRGFQIEPDAGGWTWGLELESHGFPGNEQVVVKPDRVTAEGGRVAYTWDAILEEWYVNDTRGLEHGYTLHRRPIRDDENERAALVLTLRVCGPLRSEVNAMGRDVRFLNESGSAVLSYTGLRAFDADGRELDARFAAGGGSLAGSSSFSGFAGCFFTPFALSNISCRCANHGCRGAAPCARPPSKW